VHHLSSLADGIFTNASVEAGQPLGVIGHSPKGYQLVHLHLDVAYQGKWQDPAKWVHKWRHVPYAEAWQGHGHVSGDELLG
jgi:murein DD-endopeptidase MepM/ murein hydrolase activator NlpD